MKKPVTTKTTTSGIDQSHSTIQKRLSMGSSGLVKIAEQMSLDRWPYARKRKAPIERLVIHWTGGTGTTGYDGGYAGLVRTLKGKSFSYHYVVEQSGTVVQLVGDEKKAQHAGAANEGSIGISVVGRGYLGKRTRRPGETLCEGVVHGGWRGDWVAFGDAQRASLAGLCAHLCQLHRIPVEVWEGTDYVPDWRERRGICGHMHVSTRKLDPGPRELILLARALEGAPLPV